MFGKGKKNKKFHAPLPLSTALNRPALPTNITHSVSQSVDLFFVLFFNIVVFASPVPQSTLRPHF